VDRPDPDSEVDWPRRLALHRSTAWSTRVELVVTDPGVIVEATRILNDVLERVDVVASRFRPDSEISALYRRSGRAERVVVSADLFDLVSLALRAARLTDGAVDPTVGSAMMRLGYDRDFRLIDRNRAGDLPSPRAVPGWQSIALSAEDSTVAVPAGTLLDLGATAKAWTADRAVSCIVSRLGCGALVSLGGDIAVGGPAPEGGFAVGIADVCGDSSTPATVSITSGGLASSGISNRHWAVGGRPVHHLIDPSTGLPVDSPWKTVSVAAASCTDANIASTAAMIIGEAATTWLAARRLPARLVPAGGGAAIAVSGWPTETIDDTSHIGQSQLAGTSHLAGTAP
jgi:thiamine biosynthesis lipoprotein ApbE